MNSKLYVGNLPFEIESTDLEKLFQTIGSVSSVNIIKDNYTGRAKGFGFIEMSNQNDADKAADQLNGTEFQGRSIKVNRAHDKNNGRREFRSRY
jgi:RNA recognition motif-containing protein